MQKIYYEELDSTNKELERLIQKGLIEEHTTIIAESQTHGKGQGTNEWLSPKGGLYLSSYLKPLNDIQLLPLKTALAIVKTLEELYQLELKIKWPNDIFFDKRKLAGILVETKFKGSNIDYAIVGIGINVNQESFSDKIIENKPISLKQILNKNLALDIIVEKLLLNINKILITDKFKIIKDFDKYLYLKNEVVKIKLSENNIITVQIKGINEDGALLVLDSDNKNQVLYSGRIIKT